MPEEVVEDKILKVKIEVEITESDLFDIWGTSDIGYWCGITGYNSGTQTFGTISVFDDDTEQLPEDPSDYRLFEVNPEFLVVGIQRIISPDFKINSELRSMLVNAIATKDYGDIDAEIADCIVQAACFNELVYG